MEVSRTNFSFAIDFYTNEMSEILALVKQLSFSVASNVMPNFSPACIINTFLSLYYQFSVRERDF